MVGWRRIGPGYHVFLDEDGKHRAAVFRHGRLWNVLPLGAEDHGHRRLEDAQAAAEALADYREDHPTDRERMIAEAKERRARVVELVRLGMSASEIGRELGVSRSRAYTLWRIALERGEAE